MAIIKCHICEKEISDKAKKCPYCNVTLKKNKLKTTIILLIALITFFSIICGTAIIIQNYQAQKKIQEHNRIIQEYDDSVRETVLNFHDTFATVDEKIRNENYKSLEDLVDTMKKPIEEFDQLPINEDSEFGQYIQTIKNNTMYTTFKMQYIDNDSYDLDYGLTTRGYAYLITIYTEKILEIDLPADK